MGKTKGYVLYYVDDYNKKHITYVKTMRDVNFYRDRFGFSNVTIETSLTYEYLYGDRDIEREYCY